MMSRLNDLTQQFLNEEATIREGGGLEGKKRQERLGRLIARDRLRLLLDPDSEFLELGIWAAWKMYEEWGQLPAAGVVTGIAHAC
jgi:3-methylcrotonyl-CoA carboxylase beta subunit